MPVPAGTAGPHPRIWKAPVTNDSPASLIDTTVSHSARVWNYWLGGKDHYPVDREVGDRVAEMYPDIVLLARAALTSSPEGATDYVDADLRNPGKILQEAARTLDFSKPVAITLIAILHHITDFDEGRSIVTRLMAAVPSGSYLVASHSTNVIYGAISDEAGGRWNKFGKPPVILRSPEEIAQFFDGLEVLEPGVVSTPRWRPNVADIGGGSARDVDQFCAVGRKP